LRIDDLVPLLFGHEGQQHIAVDARIVDQAVDRAERFSICSKSAAASGWLARSAATASASPPAATMLSTTRLAASWPR
jgi:hypothetical protein